MLSFEDDDGKLGVEEFTTEKEKLEAKQRLKVVRRMVGEEEHSTQFDSSKPDCKEVDKVDTGCIAGRCSLESGSGRR